MAETTKIVDYETSDEKKEDRYNKIIKTLPSFVRIIGHRQQTTKQAARTMIRE